MKQFETLNGIVAPLDRSNVDTDAIIPKQYLKSIKRSGFGPNLFDDWRYLDPGAPDIDNDSRRVNPDFILNQVPFDQAEILLARDNFGCGSSREHAVWALDDFGFRVVIAPSYADIFYNNCFKNGLLPIALSAKEVEFLFSEVELQTPYRITVNLQEQTVEASGRTMAFEIDAFRRYCLLNGLDDIGLTMTHADEIKSFEQKYYSQMPWLK